MESDEQLKHLAAESRKLLMLISRLGPSTKDTLVQATSYNRTTLNRILYPLISCGAVVEIGEEASSGGRKPSLFDINPDKYFICGVDISLYAVRIAIFDLRFRSSYCKQSFYITSESTPERVCALIAQSFQSLIDSMNITRENIVGLGLGVVGPYSRSLKKILTSKGFPAPGWDNVPIEDMLEKMLDVRVYADDGTNVVALFHYLYENEQDYRNIAFIGCGLTIRSSVIYDGRLVRSVNEGINALGHMTIIENGEFCECGSRGCVARYSSIPYIIFNYNVLKSIAIQRTDIHETFEHISRLADEGDLIASKVITNAARHLSTGVMNLVRLFGIERVIMHGVAFYSGDLYFNICKDLIMNDCHTSVKQVIKGSQGQWVVARGAAAMVLDSFVKEDG